MAQGGINLNPGADPTLVAAAYRASMANVPKDLSGTFEALATNYADTMKIVGETWAGVAKTVGELAGEAISTYTQNKKYDAMAINIQNKDGVSFLYDQLQKSRQGIKDTYFNPVKTEIVNGVEVPLENCEGMQLVHYKPGQCYKPHWDYFDTSSDIHIEETRRGGQRTWTAFLYLNDVKEGGTTNFPNIDMEVKPKIGRIVCWLNTLNGNTIEDSLHEAKPPIDCEKWGANMWVREKKFIL